MKVIYSRMKAVGVRIVRFNVLWGNHENADGRFDFDRLDKAVDLARDGGMRVYVSLAGYARAPECINGAPDLEYRCNEFARTCVEDAARGD